MSKVEEGKDRYDKIEIPEELKGRVKQAIVSVNKEKIVKETNNNQKKKIHDFRGNLMRIAAVIVIITTVGLNTSQAFAQGMKDIPVIGGLFEILTIRSYESHEDNENISVKVPSAQIEDEYETQETKVFVEDVNDRIQKIVDNYVADAQKRTDEYKQAFLETGGTEEEWTERDIDINVDYEIKYQDDKRVSFVLTGYESWVNFSQTQVYFNLDLNTNREITLQDLLGKEYIKIANEQIIAQIEEQSKNEGFIYWGYGEAVEMADEGFKTIDPQTPFYMNKAGNPVICFEKYSIGPGYMGVQEFEIQK
ncbi:MAG TPA: RsiV family protein [Lachnospiraceae bacterium]|nr:RsiV family protein [Lachnospiraceae bacterium]